MGAAAPSPLVAIVDTTVEIGGLLSTLFEMSGSSTVCAYTREVTTGCLDLSAWLDRYQPQVVVWDIPLPYEPNWLLFEQIRAHYGAHLAVVMMTTNKLALESLAGAGPVHEIISKPFDVDAIVAAVRRALAAAPRFLALCR